MPKKKTNDVKEEIKKIVKKKKRKVYFGQEVQDAIIEYNSTKRSSKKNIIYGTRIHAAFDKLAENIINTFKFTYFDDPFQDVKHEVVAFMVMNMHKYRSKDANYESDFITLTNEITEYFDNNMNNIFKKPRDLKIGYAIIDLMKQRDDIENFNKKALYILIREMTDVETAHITSVVNTLKKHYKKLLNTFNKKGTIIYNHSGSFF